MALSASGRYIQCIIYLWHFIPSNLIIEDSPAYYVINMRVVENGWFHLDDINLVNLTCFFRVDFIDFAYLSKHWLPEFLLSQSILMIEVADERKLPHLAKTLTSKVIWL